MERGWEEKEGGEVVDEIVELGLERVYKKFYGALVVIGCIHVPSIFPIRFTQHTTHVDPQRAPKTAPKLHSLPNFIVKKVKEKWS